MTKCPNCGGEVENGYNFCKYCGLKLSEVTVKETPNEPSIEAEIKNTVTRRLDGIKDRNEDTIKALLDEHYNKFDDWPPFSRQEYVEALKNEFDAFKVLSSYSYEIKDFKVNIYQDIAIATFHIRYFGEIRNKRFEVVSRVTSILNRSNSGWKVVHEHFSRFPEERRRSFLKW